MHIKNISNNSVEAVSEETGVSGIVEFVPIDPAVFAEMQPHEIFAYGIAYGVIANCGVRIPKPQIPANNSDPESEEFTTVL